MRPISTIKTLFINHILKRMTDQQMLDVMEDYYQNGNEHHITAYRAHLEKIDRLNDCQIREINKQKAIEACSYDDY